MGHSTITTTDCAGTEALGNEIDCLNTIVAEIRGEGYDRVVAETRSLRLANPNPGTHCGVDVIMASTDHGSTGDPS